MESAFERPIENRIERTSVLGVGVSAVNMDSAVDLILQWIEAGRHTPETYQDAYTDKHKEKHYVTVTGVHGVMEAQDDPAFKTILNQSGLTVPDGMPLVWLSWLAGKSHVTRVYGPNLTLALSAAMAQKGFTSFYYGGNSGVAQQLSEALESRFPGLKTAGFYCPPFRPLTDQEEDELIQKINTSKPDVVWVGLSTPKQERFMASMIHRLNCPVMIGVGAAFDFHTGRVRQAPHWMQVCGLEWFFRMIMEPRRLWKRYLKNNPRFLYLLARDKLRFSKTGIN